MSGPLQIFTVTASRALFASALLAFAGAHAWAAEGSATAAAAPRSGTTANSAAPAHGALPEVTVRGQRAELAPKVSEFVNRIAALQNMEGLARWDVPVCPLVAGLPRQEGEFIVARISEIARAAAVPLAGENCHPNLFVLVTIHPQQVLRDMENHVYLQVFGDAAPSTVDDFIAAARTVKVWYRANMGTQVGTPMSASEPGCNFFYGASPPCNLHADASHLSYNATWNFSYVFVVVDQTRLRGESRGQIADYVAIQSLAELKPDVDLRDAETILKLFGVTPQVAPAGMSAWDQAFLKALYATDPKSKLQRVNIARAMVREIVP